MSNRRTIAIIATAAAALAGTAPSAFARHGGDDPAGHDRGDDHGGRVTVRAGRHGADDPAGHDRGDDKGRHHGRHGRHGGDDGPGHH